MLCLQILTGYVYGLIILIKCKTVRDMDQFAAVEAKLGSNSTKEHQLTAERAL